VPPDDTSDGPSTTTPDAGSEFSKPQGLKDNAIWEKHYGKDAKGFEEEKPEKKQAKPSKDSAESKARPSKDSDKKEPTKDSKKENSSKERSTHSAPEHSDKPSKPKESKAETETEPDLGKARDLYAKAKKEADPGESRKLYEQAAKEAFGELPREFSGASWKASREKMAADRAEIKAAAAKNEARITEAAGKLRPAIHVMQKLQEAKLDTTLTVAQVDRAIGIMRALREVEAGDFTRLGEIIEKASGKPHDEAMRLFVRGVKVSPEGRASRQAAEDAARRADAADARVAALEQALAERENTRTLAEKNRELVQRRASYVEQIETELDGHPALKLPNGSKRILAYLIKTADKATKTPRFTFEAVADKLVNYERKRVQRLRSVVDDGDDDNAPVTTRNGMHSTPRSERADNGVLSESPEARFDRIWAKHNAGARR